MIWLAHKNLSHLLLPSEGVCACVCVCVSGGGGGGGGGAHFSGGDHENISRTENRSLLRATPSDVLVPTLAKIRSNQSFFVFFYSTDFPEGKREVRCLKPKPAVCQGTNVECDNWL